MENVVMSKLDEIYKQLIQFSNGEQVARRMTQIWDFALDPDGESLSAERVIQVIESHEEKLLQRTRLEMVTNKPILPVFEQALRQSTNEEWENFKNKHNITPLGKLDKERLFIDSSGLVRDTGFEEWVLGKESETVSVESKINLHKVIQEDRRSKE